MASTTTHASTSAAPDIHAIRAEFPALAGETVYLENAGGSQVPRVVADAIRDYMLTSYVQLGAGYGISNTSTSTVTRAHDFINLLMNGQGIGHTFLGPSCTRMMRTLAYCYSHILEPGDEIIVADTGHEANIGPWIRLDRHGATVRHWTVDPVNMSCTIDALRELLNPRTRLVAFPHVSNLLGDIVDVQAITELVHQAGARVVVDGVAYAPHRAIDVKRWDVDWYVYSAYKVFGPHMAALYGRADAIAELPCPNHYFIPATQLPYAFEPGGASHEGCAGLLALAPYMQFLLGRDPQAPIARPDIVDAFDIMTALERPVQQRVIQWLNGRDDCRIIGPNHAEDSRVATISFVHDRLASRDIATAAHRENIGIRHGHMYAYRLCETLGLPLDDGVVRISAAHYNTTDEADRLINVLEHAFGQG